MSLARWWPLAALVVIVGVPLLVRPEQAESSGGRRQLVILSPHNEQIRSELGRAFSRWHEARHGEAVEVAWSTPGGTSEIRRMLTAAAESSLRDGRPLGGSADLLFGGGSYEFGQLARPIEVEVGGERRRASILAPIEFAPEFLAEVYGENRIGDDPLFDPDGRWFGVALSGFGIVSNLDVLARLGVPEPREWADLCDRRLFGWVVLANPAQSGSVATAMEAILQRRGWAEGWAILRRMAANSRSIVSSAPKAPIDVAAGDAAAGLCIDFYGRFQAQSLRDAARALGDPALDRLAYVDPLGQTVIDPDPIAMLTGAPDPALARRFVEFVLSVEGQALWQFAAGEVGDPAAGIPPGPERFELRRMPVRREFYERFADRMIDDARPFQIASSVPSPDRAMRSFIAPIFSAAAIDHGPLLREAWRAIIEHPAFPKDRPLVRPEDVDDPRLRRMLEAFDGMPEVEAPEGAVTSLANPDARARVREGWLRGGWRDAGLWPTEAFPAAEFRRRAASFFEAQYRRVLEIAAEGDRA